MLSHLCQNLFWLNPQSTGSVMYIASMMKSPGHAHMHDHLIRLVHSQATACSGKKMFMDIAEGIKLRRRRTSSSTVQGAVQYHQQHLQAGLSYENAGAVHSQSICL